LTVGPTIYLFLVLGFATLFLAGNFYVCPFAEDRVQIRSPVNELADRYWGWLQEVDVATAMSLTLSPAFTASAIFRGRNWNKVYKLASCSGNAKPCNVLHLDIRGKKMAALHCSLTSVICKRGFSYPFCPSNGST
jgi:hypothetical protein